MQLWLLSDELQANYRGEQDAVVDSVERHATSARQPKAHHAGTKIAEISHDLKRSA
jgi:hypothetical protein